MKNQKKEKKFFDPNPPKKSIISNIKSSEYSSEDYTEENNSEPYFPKGRKKTNRKLKMLDKKKKEKEIKNKKSDIIINTEEADLNDENNPNKNLSIIEEKPEKNVNEVTTQKKFLEELPELEPNLNYERRLYEFDNMTLSSHDFYFICSFLTLLY